MARVVFRLTNTSLAPRWLQKRDLLPSVAFAAADVIAAKTDADAIPDNFPGKIRDTVTAIARPGAAGVLASVEGVVTKPLFWYYVKGTREHLIPLNGLNGPVAFTWERMGGMDVVFNWVRHPGTPPHDERLNTFLAQFRDIAYETWREYLTLFLRE